MIGNDCKLLEQNIDTFLSEFLDDDEKWEHDKVKTSFGTLQRFRRYSKVQNNNANAKTYTNISFNSIGENI